MTWLICNCGIQHDYLDYIGESEEVNEEIFDRVVECIIKGQCPHVDEVDSKYVDEARLSALHVMAAAGTSDTLEKLKAFPWKYKLGPSRPFEFYERPPNGRLERYRLLKPDGGGLLYLTLFEIAVLKNRQKVPVFGTTYVNLPIL